MSNLCGSNSGSNITTLFIRPRVRDGELRRDEILSHFSAFGDVKSVRIRNKAARSYGFVKFTHQAEALTKALKTKTIAGRTVLVTIAYDRHQEMTMTPQGNPSLLDLNDDCILKILSEKCVSTMDLCSVAENGPRLKEIAGRVFRRQHKVCDLNKLSKDKAASARRIMKNFGSVISDLRICGISYSYDDKSDKWTSVLDSVTGFCGNILESLYLKYCTIPDNYAVELRPIFNNLQKITIRHCEISDASKEELFAHCGSLVELELDVGDFKFILEKTFPKLEKFDNADGYHNFQPNIWDSFILRHPNLVSLKTGSIKSSSLPLIADNCSRLEELKYSIRDDLTFDLSNFSRLRKLNISCVSANFPNVIGVAQGLNNLTFLESLTLAFFEIESEFIQTLSLLKRLEVLKISYCTGLENLLQIVHFNQLKEIQIAIDDYHDYLPVMPSLFKRLSQSVMVIILFEDVEVNYDSTSCISAQSNLKNVEME